MSNQVSAKVHKKVLGSSTRKAVMIYFADKASDGGEGIWASKRTIAAELELHRVTVIRTVSDLVSEGILIVAGERRNRNGATVVYDINMAAVEALPDVEVVGAGVPARTSKSEPRGSAALPVAGCDGLHSATPVVAQDYPMGSHRTTQTILEPSKNHTGADASARQGDNSTVLAFERFWQAHPKPRNRDRSFELWLAAEKEGVDMQRITSAAQRYRDGSKGKDPRYLVASDNWLDQRRWASGPDAEAATAGEIEAGVRATAEMLAERLRGGRFVPPSALSPAIVKAMRSGAMVADHVLRNVGVRI